jgi:hypothetical protein
VFLGHQCANGRWIAEFSESARSRHVFPSVGKRPWKCVSCQAQQTVRNAHWTLNNCVSPKALSIIVCVSLIVQYCWYREAHSKEHSTVDSGWISDVPGTKTWGARISAMLPQTFQGCAFLDRPKTMTLVIRRHGKRFPSSPSTLALINPLPRCVDKALPPAFGPCCGSPNGPNNAFD